MTVLPQFLQENIEKEINKKSWNKLKISSEKLSTNYRRFCSTVFNSEEEYLAYLSYRLPATYAVCAQVLNILHQNFSSLPIRSLLDIGCGPGTGLFACKEIFPFLEKATLIEREKSWIEIAQRLSQGIPCNLTWQKQDIEKEGRFTPHDLVLLSYCLGEIGSSTLKRIEELWEATVGAFVLIEPGTPKGFASIWAVREKLIAWGAHILAPCPHAKECPMRGQDWCHFFARVQRTPLHRHVKGGSLGFEDEKFSYLIVTKVPSKNCLEEGRIIRPLIRKSGHIIATMCSKEGIVTNSISKKKKEIYNKVRKMDWGDGF